MVVESPETAADVRVGATPRGPEGTGCFVRRLSPLQRGLTAAPARCALTPLQVSSQHRAAFSLLCCHEELRWAFVVSQGPGCWPRVESE